MINENGFGAFRLKKDTIESLKNLKRAFELSSEQSFTNDDFIRKLMGYVQNSDSNTWGIFTTIETQQIELIKQAKHLKTKSIIVK